MGDERRDDWRNSIDRDIVNLTTAQKVTDQQIDDLEIKYESLDNIMRGDPEKETDGFIARLHKVENWIQEQDIEKVQRGITETTNQGIKWQVWGSIIVAIIGALAGIIPNFPRIEEMFQKAKEVTYQPDEKLRREIQADKRRHHRKKSLPIPSAAKEEVPSATTSESPPKNP